jgi:hypothetical protein
VTGNKPPLPTSCVVFIGCCQLSLDMQRTWVIFFKHEARSYVNRCAYRDLLKQTCSFIVLTYIDFCNSQQKPVGLISVSVGFLWEMKINESFDSYDCLILALLSNCDTSSYTTSLQYSIWTMGKIISFFTYCSFHFHHFILSRSNILFINSLTDI